jgi:hypothetical protein
MRIIFLVFLMFFAFSVEASADENGDAGVTAAPVDSFYSAMESYFRVSEDQVKLCQEANISDEETPLVFFMAQRAGVDPQAVLIVRTGGMSWMQTAYHFQLNPKVFFVSLPANSVARSPYEKSYGFYKGHSSRVNLSDIDMLNWVDLKFLSEYYGYDPQEIIQMRSAGKSFRDINSYYAGKKEQVEWDVDDPSIETPTPVVKGKEDKALEQFGNMNHGMPGPGPGGI